MALLDTQNIRRLLGPTLRYVGGKIDVVGGTGGGGGAADMAGDVTGTTDANTVESIGGIPISLVGATLADTLIFDGAGYVPGPAASGTPDPHATSHQNGGSDEISVAGLSGVLADDQAANKIRESSGPTLLTVGAVADGEYLRRSGSTIISGSPSAGAANLGYFSAYKPPTSPDADNDEFDGTSIPGNMRMWNKTSKALIASPVTALQHLRPLPGSAKGAWQQGARDSCLSFQADHSDGIIVSKTLATALHAGSTTISDAFVAESRVLWRINDFGLRSGAAGGCVFEFGMTADNAGDPDWNNRVYWQIYNYMDSSGNWENIISCYGLVAGVLGAHSWQHSFKGTNSTGGSYASDAYGRWIESERFGFHASSNGYNGYFGNHSSRVVGSNGAFKVSSYTADTKHLYWSMQYTTDDVIQRADIDYARVFRGTSPGTPLIP